MLCVEGISIFLPLGICGCIFHMFVKWKTTSAIGTFTEEVWDILGLSQGKYGVSRLWRSQPSQTFKNITECLGIWGSDSSGFLRPRCSQTFLKYSGKSDFLETPDGFGEWLLFFFIQRQLTLFPMYQSWGEIPEYFVWGREDWAPLFHLIVWFFPLLRSRRGREEELYLLPIFMFGSSQETPKCSILLFWTPICPNACGYCMGSNPERQRGLHSLWSLTQQTSWERKQDYALMCHWRPGLVWLQPLGRYFHKQ